MSVSIGQDQRDWVGPSRRLNKSLRVSGTVESVSGDGLYSIDYGPNPLSGVIKWANQGIEYKIGRYQHSFSHKESDL